MPTRATVQYTIRGIPREVDEALRKKAHQRKIGMNQLLVEVLMRATSTSAPLPVVEVNGRRVKEDPEFDRVLEAQRKVDGELWR